MLPTPPTSTLFPYTTLFRSICAEKTTDVRHAIFFRGHGAAVAVTKHLLSNLLRRSGSVSLLAQLDEVSILDRKSTRLNSSHVEISYAVFCLKKKKKK